MATELNWIKGKVAQPQGNEDVDVSSLLLEFLRSLIAEQKEAHEKSSP